jgi:hypothetical protein
MSWNVVGLWWPLLRQHLSSSFKIGANHSKIAQHVQVLLMPNLHCIARNAKEV